MCNQDALELEWHISQYIGGKAITDTNILLLPLWPLLADNLYRPIPICQPWNTHTTIKISSEHAKFIWALPDILSQEPPVLCWPFWILAGHFTVKCLANIKLIAGHPIVRYCPWNALAGHFVQRDQTPSLDIFKIRRTCLANFPYSESAECPLGQYVMAVHCMPENEHIFGRARALWSILQDLTSKYPIGSVYSSIMNLSVSANSLELLI